MMDSGLEHNETGTNYFGRKKQTSFAIRTSHFEKTMQYGLDIRIYSSTTSLVESTAIEEDYTQ